MSLPWLAGPLPSDRRFRHVLALTDELGTFEHAELAVPRRSHGYCVDDVARVLLVAVREPMPSAAVRELAHGSFRFLAAAQGVTGKVRNRRSASGRWHGKRGVEDCWGRAQWALGVAATRAEPWLRQDAAALFEHGCEQRSTDTRTMAFAALGAAALLAADPDLRPARALLHDAAAVLGRPEPDAAWPWPEPRLRYANAVLPDAMLAAGAGLGRLDLVDDGLLLLGWLLDGETLDGHLSVAPAGGRGPGDVAPGFDQQPIEVAGLAEACARAHALTGDARWATGVRLAAAWFDGDNDLGVPMWDPATGGSYDGLGAEGPNLNQGAESALALIATRQLADRLTAVPA